jgi:uncharacterized protein
MTRYPAAGSPLGALLVLAHGAGAGQRHPFMVAYATALAERGVDVVTFDFPYMAQKRRLPDKAPVLEAEFHRVIAEAMTADPSRRLFIGGKSMGGRMATHLAAQGDLSLAGVVALGYPLHPPGKPEQKRIAHLPDIRVPLLVVQGERDTFGTPSELEPELAAVPAAVDVHVVKGGDHSLAVRGRSAEEVHGEVIAAIVAWMEKAGSGQWAVGSRQ